MVGPGIANTGVANRRGGYAVEAREMRIGDSRCRGGLWRYRAFLGEHPRKRWVSKPGILVGSGGAILTWKSLKTKEIRVR